MDDKKKILIIRNDHIGDLALSTAIFRELKREFPNAKISVVVSKLTKSLVEKNKNIDEIIELEMPKKDFHSIINYIKKGLKIRKEKFDVGIDLRGSIMNSFFLMWIGSIKKRIGKSDNYTNKYLNKLISLFLTNPVKTEYYTSYKHITQENIDIVNEGLGLNITNLWPEIAYDKEDEEEIIALLRENKIKKYICICPFVNSGAEAKQWSKENYLEIIKWLNKFNLSVIVSATSNDEEDLKEMKKLNKRVIMLVNFNLRKMAPLFKKGIFSIGNDGGPMHIAWISGAKTIILLPKYHPILGKNKFSPLKDTTILFAYGNSMDNIKVEDVKREIKKILIKENKVLKNNKHKKLI